MTCLHCQKTHDRGFIWNFSETLRVCFTCYRVMGDDGRKSYEREAARSKSKKAEPQAMEPQTSASRVREPKRIGFVMKAMALIALLVLILGAGAFFLGKPLTGEQPEHRLWARVTRTPANR